MKKAKKELNEKIISLIFEINRLIRKKIQRKIRRGHLSFLELATIHYIKGKGKPIMKNIANHFLVRPSSITPLIDQLVKKKLIRRILSRKDRRKIYLTLTSEGEKMIEKELKKFSLNIKKFLASLKREEKETLIKILEKLNKNIQKK